MFGRSGYGGVQSIYGGGHLRVDESPTARRSPDDPFNPDLRWVRHPLRWLRWRWAVHRLGPYAPDFAEFRAGQRTDPSPHA